MVFQIIQRLIQIGACKSGVCCSGDVVPLHKLFRKIFAAFQLGALPARSDDRDVPDGITGQKIIHNSLYKGLFGARSEEHTSELQSLMRISYAVFCLKKKKKNIMISIIVLLSML